MVEFGSDFHKCDLLFHNSLNNLSHTIGDIRYFANGRHAIDALIMQEGWKRIWIPAYFCYEVIEHIKTSGISVELYDDYPLKNDDEYILRFLPYMDGDVLLRVNYYGLRNCRKNAGIPVPVIEDHTHAILSDWSIKSDADWCIASVRKSLPVASGGILWSPLGNALPQQLLPSTQTETMSEIRYSAMELKANYLIHGGDKSIFRDQYLKSENIIEKLELSGMDKESKALLLMFDMERWTERKMENWQTATTLLSPRINIVHPDKGCEKSIFSLIILCDSPEERMAFRQYLIQNNVYPAILWQIPMISQYHNALDFSRRMLSIHCDARYTKEDIKQLCQIINSYYD